MTFLYVLSAFGAADAAGQETRWRQHAENVRIVRDNWGIAHIYGKSDADAVFGTIYAQAEGETAIYNDLRQRLFIDPRRLRQSYRSSPAWLKTLMEAWSDGLNYFLSTHPAIAPRVIQQYEPWMALSFTEGSIGGDIESIDLRELEQFYGPAARHIPLSARIPFSAAGAVSPKREDYPAYMWTRGENPRGIHAVEVLQTIHDVTLDTLSMPRTRVKPGKSMDRSATVSSRRWNSARPFMPRHS